MLLQRQRLPKTKLKLKRNKERDPFFFMALILVADADPFYLKFYSMKLKALGLKVDLLEEGQKESS